MLTGAASCMAITHALPSRGEDHWEYSSRCAQAAQRNTLQTLCHRDNEPVVGGA